MSQLCWEAYIWSIKSYWAFFPPTHDPTKSVLIYWLFLALPFSITDFHAPPSHLVSMLQIISLQDSNVSCGINSCWSPCAGVSMNAACCLSCRTWRTILLSEVYPDLLTSSRDQNLKTSDLKHSSAPNWCSQQKPKWGSVTNWVVRMLCSISFSYISEMTSKFSTLLHSQHHIKLFTSRTRKKGSKPLPNWPGLLRNLLKTFS